MEETPNLNKDPIPQIKPDFAESRPAAPVSQSVAPVSQSVAPKAPILPKAPVLPVSPIPQPAVAPAAVSPLPKANIGGFAKAPTSAQNGVPKMPSASIRPVIAKKTSTAPGAFAVVIDSISAIVAISFAVLIFLDV